MLQLIQQKSTVLRFQGVANTLSHANPKYSYWIRMRAFANSSSWICTFATPGSQVALLAYALSLIYQDGFAENRLDTLGLINSNPFS